jgi:sarcosine oxidase subunit alpha
MSNSTQSRRLPSGGAIDRTKTLKFTFNGRSMYGHPGDTLASALMANGVSLIARSFKYHRPRGFYGAGSEDPNSMLSVRDGYGHEPAIRAGQVRLVDGMAASSVSGWPTVGFDVGAIAQIASGILAAGFYYKTFKWPNWMLFEPALSKVTGFGRPGDEPGRRSVRHRHASCDVLIIGAGPAGLAAARALQGSGLRVVVADDQAESGGSCKWETALIDGQPAHTWCDTVVREIESDLKISVLRSSTVTSAYENNVFMLVQILHDERGVRGECYWKLKARHVVLATGMIDRPLLFEGNDRPGVMLSSAVRRLIGEFAVAPAKRLAIYANNDGAYLTAFDANRAGLQVTAIIDTRAAHHSIHADEAKRLGIQCCFESHIEKTSGYRHLSGIVVRQADGRRRRFACDGLAVSGGWAPLIHLAAHRGVKPFYDEAQSIFICREVPSGWFAVGGAQGTLELADVIEESGHAAAAIAKERNVAAAPIRPCVEALSMGTTTPSWMPDTGSPKKTWVDLQNDVKISDIEIAARENYTSVEHLKRYTTLGMGTDQGRTSNVNGLAVMASLTGRQISAVGTTTFRPPYTAVRMETIANRRQGNLFRPRRYLPADDTHRAHGAVIEDFGWERPDWYRSNGARREAAIAAEMIAVREHVGVYDGSSLGKIEVSGPDAAPFLAKFYVSNIATLKPGKVRYSVMLHDDGVIFDDGVVTCIGPNHFLASPTSGNAEAVAAWFERWRQTEWPDMKVAISPVTSNWASMAIAGPKARALLERLEPEFDVSGNAFPHMEFREGTVGGVFARVARISFTGELQYEITVQSRYAGALLSRLVAADATLSPRLVGMEAWMRLRLEKGYIHVGSETNGRTTPLDVGMAPIVSKRKDDFIGKRSLRLSFATSSEREQLVGLKALDGVLEVGGRVMADGYASTPCPTIGYVTSACASPSVGASIGLALIEQGHQRCGETISVYCSGKVIHCQVCNTTFYDPDNKRLHA